MKLDPGSAQALKSYAEGKVWSVETIVLIEIHHNECEDEHSGDWRTDFRVELSGEDAEEAIRMLRDAFLPKEPA